MAETKAETAPEVEEPTTRAEILDALDDFDGAIKALNEVGVDNLTGEQAADLEGFLDARDELRTRLAGLPDPAAMKARIDSYHPVPRRPHIGGTSAKGTGSEVKADTIEATDSEFEKFLERGPFKSFGHFASCVKAGGDRPGHNPGGLLAQWKEGVYRSDNAIKALYGEDGLKAITGLNEFADSEGGVFVPTQLAAGIWKRSIDDDFNMLSLCDVIPVSGNSVRVRAVNDKSRANGARNGGVTGYWLNEGGQGTNTKPTYRSLELRLHKLMILVPATEELLEDSVAAESEINRVAAEEVRFMVNDALYRGTGVGQPLGLLNATCKVDVTSNNGANTTLSATDIDNMWARRARASGMGYIWLCNQDCEPQLAKLNYAVTNATHASFAYTPGEAFNGAGLPRLKGKPVYYNEFSETLGTIGDIMLIDPKQIAVAVKSTGVKSSVSTHLRFDYDESVFKFTFRLDARPYWETSLTRYKGSNALSPIIALESARDS
jgi:HK97 family phage major capsid protein